MIKGELIGAAGLLRKMNSLAGAADARVEATMKASSAELEALVKSKYLRGPRPFRLGIKSGRLISSIYNRVSRMSRGFYMQVGTNVKYGAYWEDGFTRRIGAGAHGGPRTKMTANQLADYFAKHPPGTQKYKRPFLRPALNEIAPKVGLRLREAVQEEIKRRLSP